MTQPDSTGRVDGTEPTFERGLRTPRAAGIAGIAFAALFITSFLLLRDSPAAGSSAAEIERWYLGEHARTIAIVGVYLAPFAGIAFLWFIAVLRDRIGRLEDRFFSTVFVGSGLLFVAMLFGAVAAGSASLNAFKFQDAPLPTPDVVVFERGLAYTFLYVYGARVAGVFMIVVSTIAWQTATLPRWLVLAGYAIALVLLLGVAYSRWIVLLFPCWVAVVSIVILIGAHTKTVQAQE